MKELFNNRYFRRIFFTIIILVVADSLTPKLLDYLESKHYDGSASGRFEQSDVFALGPTLEYLSEHPVSIKNKKRILFLGNSITWGYKEKYIHSLPYYFKKLAPDYSIYNLSYNGHRTGDSYLILKEIASAIDIVYMFAPNFPDKETNYQDLIKAPLKSFKKVEPQDLAPLGLIEQKINPINELIQKVLSKSNLFRYSYRIQTALWNASTQLYIFSQKRAVFEALFKGAPLIESNDAAADQSQLPFIKKTVSEIKKPWKNKQVCTDSLFENPKKYSRLFDLYKIISKSGKKILLADFVYNRIDHGDLDKLNCLMNPYIYIISLAHPPQHLTIDNRHLNALGAETYAKVLYELSMEIGLIE